MIISVKYTTCFVIVLYSWTHAELYSAISDMESLIKTHKRITDNLYEYLCEEEKKLDILKKFLNIVKIEHDEAVKDMQNYLENPINCFVLIKRLTHDLELIEHKITNITVYRKDKTLPYPSKDDMKGAMWALHDLVLIYNLNITQLANGILRGNFSQFNQEFREIVIPMTTSDCFMLGQNLFSRNLLTDSIPWLLEALSRYKVEEHNQFTKEDIMQHISKAYYNKDDIKQALDWTTKILKALNSEDPRYMKAKISERYYKQLIYYTEEISRNKKKNNKEFIHNGMKKKPTNKKVLDNKENLPDILGSLCRGERDLPRKVVKRLKCRYLTENHPFLRLAPIKMEQLYFKPDIFLFHEVLSIREIQTIKNISKPWLRRAQSYDETGKFGLADYRVCKITWLPNNASEIRAVAQRISDFTGLSMETAEHLQVANYGIGGYYVPHFDHSNNTQRKFMEYGNRIATTVFYLSDVAQGGATVFPQLGLTVFPVRGAALFWCNLHPSGEGDEATLHAGCPVVHGSKWIANTWIKELGQIFRRPCTTYRFENSIQKNILI